MSEKLEVPADDGYAQDRHDTLDDDLNRQEDDIDHSGHNAVAYHVAHPALAPDAGSPTTRGGGAGGGVGKDGGGGGYARLLAHAKGAVEGGGEEHMAGEAPRGESRGIIKVGASGMHGSVGSKGVSFETHGCVEKLATHTHTHTHTPARAHTHTHMKGELYHRRQVHKPGAQQQRASEDTLPPTHVCVRVCVRACMCVWGVSG